MDTIDAAVVRLKTEMSDIKRRIDVLEDTTKTIESLTLSVERLALSVQQIAKEQVTDRGTQNDLAKRLLEVEQAPAKDEAGKYAKIKSQLITLVIGALVGYLFKALLNI